MTNWDDYDSGPNLMAAACEELEEERDEWKTRALAAEAKLASLDELDAVLTRSAADEIKALRDALERVEAIARVTLTKVFP